MLSSPKTHIPHGKAGPKVWVLELMISSMRAFAFVSLVTRSSPMSFMISGPTMRYTSVGERVEAVVCDQGGHTMLGGGGPGRE